MRFLDLGRISFQEGLKKQEKALQETLHRQQPETVYLLEHPHVFTIGRAGKAENILSRKDGTGQSIELVATNRGGDVTYHGPGQLIGYPHLDLRKRGRDVHRFLRDLEKSLIQTAAHYNVKAFVRPGLTGVWSHKGKLASIGIGVSRWITRHGFALNVNTDLSYFKLIHPCGILNCPVTSLSDLLGGPIDLDEVKRVFQSSFEEVFELPVSLLEQPGTLRSPEGAAGNSPG
jgi:lipoyl(octanoyl) transferase